MGIFFFANRSRSFWASTVFACDQGRPIGTRRGTPLISPHPAHRSTSTPLPLLPTRSRSADPVRTEGEERVGWYLHSRSASCWGRHARPPVMCVACVVCRAPYAVVLLRVHRFGCAVEMRSRNWTGLDSLAVFASHVHIRKRDPASVVLGVQNRLGSISRDVRDACVQGKESLPAYNVSYHGHVMVPGDRSF